ncbi:hypothetical protein ACFVUN_35870 [Kitasatospora griseola]|uniref:hypothetical protein n=1 Tax=Kitasatospora griseola TaxID=2064 RepID=UPI0036DD0A8E
MKMFQDAIKKKASSSPRALPVKNGEDAFPYNHGKSGDFLYIETWEYISRNLVEDKELQHLSFDGPASQIYLNYVESLYYNLSPADKKKYEAAENKAEKKKEALVLEYEKIFGKIDPQLMKAGGVKTRADYIIFVKLNEWAGSESFTFDQETIDNPAESLPKMPDKAKSLLPLLPPALSPYLEISGLVNMIEDTRKLRPTLARNIKSPDKDNGGIATHHENAEKIKYQIGFKVTPEISEIASALKKDSKIDIKVKFKNFKDRNSDLEVENSPAGNAVTADVFSIIDNSGNFSVADLNTGTPECSLEVAYEGLVDVHISPTLYQTYSKEGWHHPEALKKALENDGKTGYALDPYPKDSGIRILRKLTISRFPRITISYPSGTPTDAVKKICDAENVGILLFGSTLGTKKYQWTVSFNQADPKKGFSLVLRAPTDAADRDRRAVALTAEVDVLMPRQVK